MDDEWNMNGKAMVSHATYGEQIPVRHFGEWMQKQTFLSIPRQVFGSGSRVADGYSEHDFTELKKKKLIRRVERIADAFG